ncbi:MAG: phage tail protein [Candidatus Promineifilaceae bacterium]
MTTAAETNAPHRATANPAFRFLVAIDKRPVAVFTKCTLPTIEWDLKTVRSGGVNDRTFQLAGPLKTATSITLEAGVGPAGGLIKWYISTMSQVFTPVEVSITLCKGPSVKVMAWHLQGCLPLKWSGPQLQTDSTAIAIHSLELAYEAITVQLLNG